MINDVKRHEVVAADDSHPSCFYNIALYRQQCNPDSDAQNSSAKKW